MVVLATGGMNLSVGAIGVSSVMLAGCFLQVLRLAHTARDRCYVGLRGGAGVTERDCHRRDWREQRFVVTLATASLFSGGMLILSHGVPLNGLPPEIGVFGKAAVGPVPALAIVALAIGGLLLHPVRA